MFLNNRKNELTVTSNHTKHWQGFCVESQSIVGTNRCCFQNAHAHMCVTAPALCSAELKTENNAATLKGGQDWGWRWDFEDNA